MSVLPIEWFFHTSPNQMGDCDEDSWMEKEQKSECCVENYIKVVVWEWREVKDLNRDMSTLTIQFYYYFFFFFLDLISL